jgi:hypothetical protein
LVVSTSFTNSQPSLKLTTVLPLAAGELAGILFGVLQATASIASSNTQLYFAAVLELTMCAILSFILFRCIEQNLYLPPAYLLSHTVSISKLYGFFFSDSGRPLPSIISSFSAWFSWKGSALAGLNQNG